MVRRLLNRHTHQHRGQKHKRNLWRYYYVHNIRALKCPRKQHQDYKKAGWSNTKQDANLYQRLQIKFSAHYSIQNIKLCMYNTAPRGGAFYRRSSAVSETSVANFANSL